MLLGVLEAGGVDRFAPTAEGAPNRLREVPIFGSLRFYRGHGISEPAPSSPAEARKRECFPRLDQSR